MENVKEVEIVNDALISVQKLSRDLRDASALLGPEEARFLVDAYYQMQEARIRNKNQARSIGEEEPAAILGWLAGQNETLEGQVRGALAKYAAGCSEGEWLLGICGIGPVISAGLICHIDVDRAKTAGQVWRFAGLDPTVSWDKGKKRPWNASLKRLCFLIGESFVKVKSNPNSVYAALYEARKASEIKKNDLGLFAEQAKASLEAKKFRDDTEAKKHYLAGHLPPARIHLRAKRYMVKVFLADFHAVATWCRNGELPPVPYILNQPGHVHHMAPPHMEDVAGMTEAWEARRKALGLVGMTAEEQAKRI